MSNKKNVDPIQIPVSSRPNPIKIRIAPVDLQAKLLTVHPKSVGLRNRSQRRAPSTSLHALSRVTIDFPPDLRLELLESAQGDQSNHEHWRQSLFVGNRNRLIRTGADQKISASHNGRDPCLPNISSRGRCRRWLTNSRGSLGKPLHLWTLHSIVLRQQRVLQHTMETK